jgi:hypothetical protein
MVLRLYFTTNKIKERNYKSLVVLNKPIKKILARHTSRNTIKATEEKADNLFAEVHMCIRAWVILIANLWTENGLVNGLMGSIHDITWSQGQDPSSFLLSLLLIKFAEYIKPDFPGYP